MGAIHQILDPWVITKHPIMDNEKEGKKSTAEGSADTLASIRFGGM